MSFLILRGNRYYYNRRVPEHVKEYDHRTFVRVALRTDSKQQARRKAVMLNEQVEAYWQSLLIDNQPHDNTRFGKTVQIARKMGFAYQPLADIAILPIPELVARVLATQNASPIQIEAVLGGREQPSIKLSQALEQFWTFAKDKTLNKSAIQITKWENPRKKAIKNFIAVVGNKAITEITREDIIAFQHWWLRRIEKDEMCPDTANKNIIHLKTILETVSDNLSLKLDIAGLFKKVVLKKRIRQTRKPFTKEQALAILQSPKLENMHPEAKAVMMVMSETGMRPSEIAGLLPEDIRLNGDVPYLAITDRSTRALKTPHSQREIPLVGFALDAMQQFHQGFPYYRDRPDTMTTAINKFMRENKLLPSLNHSLYSFRHYFQDRLTAVNAPDRVQAELMGHKFNRPKYGDGASLKLKNEWLNRIAI